MIKDVMADDSQKVRGSLMLFSVYLIVYWLGEGDIGASGEVRIGTITFGDPVWVKTVGMVIFFYLYWRYHINAKIQYRFFKADIYRRLVASSSYINFVACIGSFPGNFSQEQAKQIRKDKSRWPSTDFDEYAGAHDRITTPLPDGYLSPSIVFYGNTKHPPISWVDEVLRICKGNEDLKAKGVHPLTQTEKLAVQGFIRKAFLENLKEGNEFYQIVLPYIMAGFGVYAMLAKLSMVLANTLLFIVFVCALITLRKEFRTSDTIGE